MLGGKLLVLGPINSGGMGEVYVAWHATLDCEVAVKVLPEHLRAHPESVNRFRKTIQAQARIGSHNHIAATMDAAEENGRLYLVMEYVPGMDLARYVRRQGPLRWSEACDYLRQAATGLEHAHSQGIIHRDIKPSNLIRSSSGKIKILDWGLARCDAVDGDPALDTQTGIGLGTADYVAPEQARDASRADQRSDLYSLGCTLFFLLTGQAPFADEPSKVAKVLAHESKPTPRIARFRKNVPPAVDDLVQRLMAKRPQDRFASATELIDALHLLEGGQPLPEPAWRRGRRTLVATMALFAGGMCWSVWHLVRSSADPVARGAPPQFGGAPPALEDLTLWFIPPAISQRNIDPVPLISDRRLASQLPDRRVAADEGFRITGRFQKPESWWLLWIDTRGKLGLPVGPGKKQAAVGYKLDGSGTRISPDDPPGTHVLLLVTGADEAPDARQKLAAALNTAPLPPRTGLHVWCAVEEGSQFRGEGESIETPESYVTQLRDRLPTGFQLAAAIFLPAEQAIGRARK
ncbi:MAG TPA: serine/threonine-protein kinase [Pirellulales bacterium]